MQRKIIRIAFLQEYKGKPEELLDLVKEVRKKGYGGVAFSAKIATIEKTRKLAEKAYSQGLKVYLFTGYMKYEEAYLAKHPEQKMVLAEDIIDQDGLSSSNWGCPFNPDFKKRYFDFLKELAAMRGVKQIWVNDEADMRTGCYCPKCQADYEQEMGGKMPLITEADEFKWQKKEWRKFLKWRINRWNKVHSEMKEVIKKVNPKIKVIFQASPSVDLCWNNPWQGAVDLSSMVEEIDGICVDPYYTAHQWRPYDPPEVYLSEWCRFIKGITPEEKDALVIPQAFSHPTFSRPLDERDGYWAAVIPIACGIDYVAPYTYELMKCSQPLMKTYEKSFQFDNHFKKVKPLKYVGLIHGALTEIYYRPLPAKVPLSYDGTRVMPCAESLRNKGIPYSYIADRRLTLKNLKQYETVILPEIDCLDKKGEKAIKEYWENGGNIIALGQLGIADSTGKRKDKNSLLREIFGIEVLRETGKKREFKFIEEHPISKTLPRVDEEIATKYFNGIMRPLISFTNCMDVKIPSKAKVIAEFLDSEGRKTGKPAIVISEKENSKGKLVYMAGFPTRTVINEKHGRPVRNLAHWILPAVVEWISKNKPVLRVEKWPPIVPMEKVRPLDARYVNTFEFFPLIGENFYIGVVASYFKEPTTFSMIATIPEDKKIKNVKELINDENIVIKVKDREVKVEVELGYKDALKIFLFNFG